MALLPNPAECTAEAARKAMKFLVKEWLGDVATDYAGQCIIIAAALTIIERSLLPERPVFFVTAGRSKAGKTTLLTMLVMAATGLRPAASAWSINEEERRKTLLAYFLSGVPYILWDNIAKGMMIACPHIEKAATSLFYADRKLGVSEAVLTAASTIVLFTGNNIGPKGDLATRSLQCRLDVDRADPENRTFKHPDPIAWTEAHRAEILRALYVILLSNPQLKKPLDAAGKTRFKTWWRLVGSAVEHAANDKRVDFGVLFSKQEADDDEMSSLADALEILARVWPKGTTFRAAEVARLTVRVFVIDKTKPKEAILPNDEREVLREVFVPDFPADKCPSSKTMGRRLQRNSDAPTMKGDRTFILRYEKKLTTNDLEWRVDVKDPPRNPETRKKPGL